MSGCISVAVRCVAETQPARGVLEPLTHASVTASDFCNNNRAGWLPRQVAQNDGAGRFPCKCDPSPWMLQKVQGAPLRARCIEGSSFRTFQCGLPTLPPLTTARGPFIDVLVATADHFGHGFFAIVERVVNQVLYARWAGLEPYVFVGERAFADSRSCQQGLQPYFDAKHGANVWDYYFEQPGRWRPAMITLADRRVRSLQVVSAESLYQLALPANFTQAYQGDVWREYSRAARTETRRAAHQLLGSGGLVRASILERAAAKFAGWRAASGHILGVHVRGRPFRTSNTRLWTPRRHQALGPRPWLKARQALGPLP